MKTNLLYSIVLLLLVSITNYAQNNCSKYYPLKEGVRSVVTTYDNKDRVSGSVKYEIKDVTDQGATMVNEIFDDKGKSLLNSEVTLQCNDDGISIDFKSLISSQIIDQYKASGMEVNMTGTNISIPNDIAKTNPALIPIVDTAIPISIASIKKSIAMETYISHGISPCLSALGPFVLCLSIIVLKVINKPIPRIIPIIIANIR